MGNTPLHDLVFVGNIEMLTRWIEGHDADVEIVTKVSKSPYMLQQINHLNKHVIRARKVYCLLL